VVFLGRYEMLEKKTGGGGAAEAGPESEMAKKGVERGQL